MKLENITGVVVLYNPSQSNLNQLINTSNIFDELIVVNNSPENKLILDFQNSELFPKNIILLNNATNLGIAQALNYGIDTAQSKGYEWVVTLDQDSNFELNNLIPMIELYNNLDDDSIKSLCPSIINHGVIEELEIINDKEYLEIESCICSGNLISISAWEEVGKFKEFLFIDTVDIDYCYELRKRNYKIIRVQNSKLIHEIGEPLIYELFSHKILMDKHSRIRKYYIIRNNVYLLKKWFFTFPKQSVKFLLENLIKLPIKILIFEKNKMENLKTILNGFYDGIIGKLGMKN
jgi:rhamnosyltransferase